MDNEKEVEAEPEVVELSLDLLDMVGGASVNVVY